MIDKYTQIMADAARDHDTFAPDVRQAIEISRDYGVPTDQIVARIAHGIHLLAVRSMVDVSAPDFAHQILLAVFEQIDWAAAAEAAFFVTPELN
jgi:hypothetical protein